MSEEEKPKVGRPSKYKEEYCALLVEHLDKGYSFESFAGVVDVCKQTIYTWKEEHPEFLDALSRGMAKCQLAWEETGMAQARGDIKGSSATWIFNMKNRFGWRDQQVIEIQESKITIDTDDEQL